MSGVLLEQLRELLLSSVRVEVCSHFFIYEPGFLAVGTKVSEDVFGHSGYDRNKYWDVKRKRLV